jgi:HrpA-like RNA helicase
MLAIGVDICVLCIQTTQVPQIILDDCIKKNKGSETFIICTQPRRIAAVTVSARVAEERLENVGRGAVGYQIRLNSKYCENTKILFCTTGILLRRLQQPGFLKRVSHVIIDEVHERQVADALQLSAVLIMKCLLIRWKLIF